MDFKKLTTIRLVMAVVSTILELTGIWLIWKYLLPYFDIYLPLGALVAALALWMVFSVWLFVFTTIVLKKQKPIGVHSMLGTKGKVVERLCPMGMVRIKNELWSARSNGPEIERGAEITVVEENGLILNVVRTEVIKR